MRLNLRKRLTRITLPGVLLASLICSAVVCLLQPAPPRRLPLWPGSQFTAYDRDRAVERGLSFVYQIARDQRNFAIYGHDLLFLFANIAATSANPRLQRLARSMGHERAVAWSREYPWIGNDVAPGTINELIVGADAAEELGVGTSHLWAALQGQAARFGPEEYYYFDPKREPPPDDVPEDCARCGWQNRRGIRLCEKCGDTLQMRSRYDVWQEALVSTYQGEHRGVLLGARHADVVRWAAAMRPYGVPRRSNYDPILFAATHLLYTSNRYGRDRLAPKCWQDEFAYILAGAPVAIDRHDPESLGECLDTLRSLGLETGDAPLRQGIEYLLRSQNSDGSWGEMHNAQVYDRYHATWTAIDGLREYRWEQTVGCEQARSK